MAHKVIQDLAESSLASSPGEFLNLLEDVEGILAEERRSGRCGSCEVNGGLVSVPPTSTMTVFGDIHGDLDALTEALLRSGFLQDRSGLLVFMGDYGDRGEFSVEVYYIVLALKARHPSRVILLRGNHEGPADLPFQPHDLPYYFVARYGEEGRPLYRRVRELWDKLHHAVIVKDSYLILHGGIPSEAKGLEDIAYAHERHPRESHLEEILWNDPVDDIKGTAPSWRGCGKLFGPDVTERLLKLVNCKTLIRGHEPVQRPRVNHYGMVLTVFSCKRPYMNPTASILRLDGSLMKLDGYGLSKAAVLF